MPADVLAPPPVVAMRDITIRFPGVLALDGVDLVLRAGEVHALMGENGAGKSTLIKALTGVYSVDHGTITVAGDERAFGSTADAQRAGISTVYQEVNLCTNLSVGENVMLGHEVRSRRGINWKATHREAARHLESLGLDAGHPLPAVGPLDRGAAAGRHQPVDGAGRPRAGARRTHLEPRPGRGRPAVHGGPRPPRQGCGHPLRQPLPRAGLRDLGPHHGAAQRQARRRVLRQGPAPRRSGDEDGRAGDRRARGDLGDRRATRRPFCGARAASDRDRPTGGAGAGRPRRLRR